MKNRFIQCCIVSNAILLSSCTSLKDQQQNAADVLQGIRDTASGSVQELQETYEQVLQTGEELKNSVTGAVEDVKRRVDQVQSGVHLMMEGKTMIEGAVE